MHSSSLLSGWVTIRLSKVKHNTGKWVVCDLSIGLFVVEWQEVMCQTGDDDPIHKMTIDTEILVLNSGWWVWEMVN